VSAGFAGRTIEKEYFAVVRGWGPEAVELDYPLDDDEVAGSARVEARTSFRLLERVELPFAVGRYPSARYSLVAAMPHTGRRHQIRRHLAHLRHPIIGDAVHGDGRHNRFMRESFGIGRLLLHGRRLRFAHPVTGRDVEIVAPPTDELAALFDRFGWAVDIPRQTSR
jgi:tRNA pseudouridine65 synthase